MDPWNVDKRKVACHRQKLEAGLSQGAQSEPGHWQRPGKSHSYYFGAPRTPPWSSHVPVQTEPVLQAPGFTFLIGSSAFVVPGACT